MNIEFVGHCRHCDRDVRKTLPLDQSDNVRIRVSCKRCGRTTYCDSANDHGERNGQRWNSEALCVDPGTVDCWFPEASEQRGTWGGAST